MNPSKIANNFSGAEGGVRTLNDLFDVLLGLINQALPVLFALAVLAFFWGLVTYVFALGSGGDEKKQQQGKNLIIWGLVAFFVMLSVFGLISIIQESFGLKENSALTPPTILKK